MTDGGDIDERGRAKWRPLLALTRRQWKGLAVGVAVGLLWTAGKVAIPLLTGRAIDRAIEGPGSAWGWALLIACAGSITGTFTALRRYVAFSQSRLTERRLREQLLEHILGLHIGFHDRAQTGQLMSRASSDLNQIQIFVVMIPLTLSNVALITVVGAVLFFDRIRIDDPVGAVSVHGICGVWGTLAIGLFARYDDAFLGREDAGLFYGGGLEQLIMQGVLVLIVAAWVIPTAGLVFFGLKKTIGLRVSEEEEVGGLDVMEHGTPGYHLPAPAASMSVGVDHRDESMIPTPTPSPAMSIDADRLDETPEASTLQPSPGTV